MEASALVSSLGVNVHLNFTGTAYQNLAGVQGALDYLGLKAMRDMGAQRDATAYATLANKGYNFDFVAPGGRDQLDIKTLTERLHAFATAYPGAIASLEGPNEVNHWPISYGGATDLAAAKAYQQAFFDAAKGDSALRALPMINLSLAAGRASTYAPLGDMSGAANFGNAHPYVTHGAQPHARLSALVGYAQATTPGLRMVISESGYPTLPSHYGQGVDEATQAKLSLNLVLDATRLGVAKTFLYELADDPHSGGGAWDYGGLYHSDWTPKPAAVALHNLITTLTTSAGGIPTPAAPAYTVSGLTAHNDSLTVHETDGTYAIVIWSEPDIWDAVAHTPIAAAAQTATIQLRQAVGGYAIYDPLIGTAPIRSGGATSRISVQVTDHPLVVELHGATTSDSVVTAAHAVPAPARPRRPR